MEELKRYLEHRKQECDERLKNYFHLTFIELIYAATQADTYGDIIEHIENKCIPDNVHENHNGNKEHQRKRFIKGDYCYKIVFNAESLKFGYCFDKWTDSETDNMLLKRGWLVKLDKNSYIQLEILCNHLNNLINLS